MSNTADIKNLNISSVLRVLHQHKALTKNEIARLLGVSTVTAHNLINELKEALIVTDTGEYAYSGGRKATLYKINEGYGCAVGVRMSRYSIHTTVYSISLGCMYENTQKWDMNSVADCIETMNDEIARAVEACKDMNILGLGITIPGHCNQNGIVLNMPDRQVWNNISIYEAVGKVFRFPIYIDNDNNAEALAAKWTGIASNYEDYVYLSVDEGTGVGVVMNGQLFYGSNYYCCELGHIPVKPDGLLCNCGNNGCLQAYTGSDSIYSRIQEKHAGVCTPEAVAKLYSANDVLVLQTVDEAVSYTALAIEYIIRIFDPKCVILQSKLLAAMPDMFLRIQERVFRLNIHNPNQNTATLIFNDQSQTIYNVAPSCLVINSFYTIPKNNRITAKEANDLKGRNA